jgi:hypothetical protein
MSQPPGQFGGPYGPPGAYGPPPYGAPVGPTGYGAPPPRNNALPWLIVGAAVLLSGLGLLLVFLLPSDRDPTPAGATAPSAESSTSASAAPTRPTEAGGLVGGATRAPSSEVDAGPPGRYAGSADVALAWVRAMADGDFETAFASSCPQVQQAAVDADDGSGPAWTLGTYFFEQTLGGVGFTEGSFDGLVHDAASASDVATFTLQLDSGEAFVLLVYVGPDLTVCDFR